MRPVCLFHEIIEVDSSRPAKPHAAEQIILAPELVKECRADMQDDQGQQELPAQLMERAENEMAGKPKASLKALRAFAATRRAVSDRPSAASSISPPRRRRSRRRAASVRLRVLDAAKDEVVAVEAAHAILALPKFVAARVLAPWREAPPAFLAETSWAPWLVANLTLRARPKETGFPLAWDNVIYDSPLLGYVVATHQGLQQHRRDTVITYYWPLSESEPNESRKTALTRSLGDWQGYITRDLLRVHPELHGRIENIDVRVWGHAMIRPTPGFIWGEARQKASAHRPPVFFAHSDLSGISIFEEAYCRGNEAGRLAARYLTAAT